jgi:hypothetical protein
MRLRSFVHKLPSIPFLFVASVMVDNLVSSPGRRPRESLRSSWKEGYTYRKSTSTMCVAVLLFAVQELTVNFQQPERRPWKKASLKPRKYSNQ